MSKKHGRYEDHPHVIAARPRPVVERARLTVAEFEARYHALSPFTTTEGSTVLVTLIDGHMRYVIEVQNTLVHDGRSSG